MESVTIAVQEFYNMSDEDRAAALEALEHGTVNKTYGVDRFGRTTYGNDRV